MKFLRKICLNTEGELNVPAMWLRFLFLIIPNCIDFILTIISYDNESKLFFIVRFVNQFLYIIFSFSAGCCSAYDSSDGIDGFFPCLFFCCSSCFIIGLEIPSLIYLIKYFNDLENLAIISYFFHWIIIPYLFVNLFLNNWLFPVHCILPK